MKLWPTTKRICECDTDVTAETSMMEVHPRVWPGRRAKQIHHYRERDGARFWHWSDRQVVRI